MRLDDFISEGVEEAGRRCPKYRIRYEERSNCHDCGYYHQHLKRCWLLMSKEERERTLSNL